MARTVFDCAKVPDKAKRCTLQLIGEKDDVLAAAKQHLISAHGARRGKKLDDNVNQAVAEHAKPYSTWV